MVIKYHSTAIFVRDVQTSRKFYEGLLGQTVTEDYGRFVNFEGGFGIWQAEYAFKIVFDRPFSKSNSEAYPRCELYFETNDLETIWQCVSDVDVDIIHPVREQPWGQRGFRLFDPDKNVVEIAEPLSVVVSRFLEQGLSIEETAERIDIPVEEAQRLAAGGD